MNVKLDDIDCIVYTNVSIKTLTCERDAGYSFRVAFQPPQAIMKLGSKGAEEYWDRSRKLSSGAVVVVFMPRQNYDKSKDLNLGIHDWAVNGPFEITFAEIVNHDTRKSHGDCCGGHGQQKHCIVLKNIDISKGSNRVHLSWFELMVTGLMSKKVKSINAPETGFMIEITAVLFNAYIPVLETLKGLSRNVQEMPFQRYLAPEADLKEILVQQPSYSLIDGFSFNFDPLKKAGSESFRYIPSNDLNYNKIALNWLSDNSNLDEGQRQSLLDCLTREVTLIQGAPGKSF